MRTALRLTGLPLRALERQTEFAGWNRTWRRYLTSNAGRRMQTQAWNQSAAGVNTAPSRLLHAAKRARSAPTTVSHPARTIQRRGFRFSPWNRSNKAGEAGEEQLSLGARLRKLSREYGKAAVGVYFILSVLDFPVFFLLVKAVGAERVGMLCPIFVWTACAGGSGWLLTRMDI